MTVPTDNIVLKIVKLYNPSRIKAIMVIMTTRVAREKKTPVKYCQSFFIFCCIQFITVYINILVPFDGKYFGNTHEIDLIISNLVY